MTRFTAVLLSWKRPHNLPRILDSLRAIDEIGEILLWNNDPARALALDGVRVFNAPLNYKCFARYPLATLAAHDHLWFQDDDVLFSPAQFARLRDAYLADPSRIVGPRGRTLAGGQYQAVDAFGEVDVVIGLAMMFHKALLQHAFDPLALLDRPEISDDISFGLLCRRKHLAVDVGPIEDLGMADGAALSILPEHLPVRQARVEMTLRALAVRPRPHPVAELERYKEEADVERRRNAVISHLVDEVRRLEVETERLRAKAAAQEQELMGLREQLSSRTVRSVQKGIQLARAALRTVRRSP